MREINRSKSPVRHLAKVPVAAAFVSVVGAAGLAQAADDATLSTVQVTADRKGDPKGTADTYNAPVTTVGRTAQAARDIPQSTTSVTREIMNDQGANNLKDALRNVAGVTFTAGENGRSGDAISLRGFSATTDLFLDNIRDTGQYNRDTFNIDRVEVLRGPSSMIYGRGSTGGVINQVSKTPFQSDASSVTLGIGTEDYYRFEGDINKGLSDTAGLRINLMGQDSESTRDGGEAKRWGVAPSVTFGIGEPTEVTFSYFHMQENNIPDYGVPFLRGTDGISRPLPVDPKTYYGLPEWDYEDTKTDILSAKVSHQFTPDIKVTNNTRYGRYWREIWPSPPRMGAGVTSANLTDNSQVTRSRNGGREGLDEILTNVTDATFNFDTGTIRHQVLAGLELTRETSDTTRWGNVVAPPPATVGNPNNNPAMPAPIKNYTTNVQFDSNNVAVYLQDFIAFTPQWKFLIGARWDYLDADYDTKTFATNTTTNVQRTDSEWSWRTGLVYQPDAIQSYYVSYGTSFNPSAEAYSLDPKGANTPPESNRNYEIGAKWDLFEGDLSLRTALFRTEKYNERNTDPLVSDRYVLSGKRKTDGLEIEVAGRITESWNVFAGWAWMDAEIVETKIAAEKGKVPLNTPDYTASLWTTYQIDQFWKAGFGANAIGERYANNTNTTVVPSYVRWDAMVEWNYRDYSVQLNVYNLFDKTYYDSVYAGHVVPGNTRYAHLSGTYRF
ncbi:TonB-dependent receptor [Jeongeupia chitinilytica]|uniref:Iron transport outer membrane receptor n=1 Tax=Jeongeupia chitinilytica TaxID=1041641 RepID=A0ABQ3GUG9_9NEIS|nr:TonB-dependent siderophore receptor [Jeongeupia chitinilytica]GHD55667.1 iron transport outer membrane receptor [Jeongeupia chitinilytica]